MPVEIHYIEEIPGPSPLPQRPYSFTECLFVCVAIRRNPVFGPVAVGIKHLALNWREYQPFIGCEIDFNFGPAT